MTSFAIGFAGNLFAVILAIALWGGHRERAAWVYGFPTLLGVLVVNVTGWLVVLA